jgi:GNAT superfamily N-acetyltransferase
MLEIRKATAADCAQILQFINDLAEFEKLSHEVQATEDALRDTLFSSNRGAEVLMAHWNKEPAGFALFFSTYSTFLARPGLYLEDLFVSPVYRSRGIGSALLKHLAGLAVERGCGRLEWSVLDWNERAIALYRRIGAKPMNDWTVQRLTGAALSEFAQGKES